MFWLDRASPNNRWNSNNNVFITRLHVRYNRDNFPEDLKFQSTSDKPSGMASLRSNFQRRYIIRHPFRGEITCSAASNYQQEVVKRQEQQAQNLTNLTGWDIKDIRSKITFVESNPIPWWRSIWQ